MANTTQRHTACTPRNARYSAESAFFSFFSFIEFVYLLFVLCYSDNNNDYDDDNDGCILYSEWMNGIGMRVRATRASTSRWWRQNWTINNKSMNFVWIYDNLWGVSSVGLSPENVEKQGAKSVSRKIEFQCWIKFLFLSCWTSPRRNAEPSERRRLKPPKTKKKTREAEKIKMHLFDLPNGRA